MAKQGKAYVLTEAEISSFCGFLAQKRHFERNLALYMLTRRAALRIGECAKLRLSDVLNSKGEINEVVTLRSEVTKGKKIRTAYFSHPQLVDALKQYISQRPKYKSDYLFISQKGTPFSPASLSRVMSLLYHEAGFEDATSHSGRRGAASALNRSGLDIVSLSKFMGHTSITTTQEYIEIDQATLINAIKVA